MVPEISSMKAFNSLLLAVMLVAACTADQPEAAPHPPPVAPGSARTIRPQDVSVLFPNTSASSLWAASMATSSGPLLPRAAFDLNARSLVREVADDAEYDALRVVGMRFDPCFQRVFGGDCEPQIRLVLQVPDPTDPNGSSFADGAVHALYALSEDAFERALTDLKALAAADATPTSSAPLGVHPTLAQEGVSGPFGRGLARIAAAHLGPATLTRVTFMTRTAASAGQWQFSGFEILDRQDNPSDQLVGTRLPIAGISATMQNVTRDRHTPEADHVFVYTVHPLFAEKDGRVGASGIYLTKATPDEKQRVHAWALRQESATGHLPDTTDCASCHIANHIGRRLEALDPSLPLESARPARVSSPAESDPDNLRAFGYFGPHPQVSQRTANETAAILHRLRTGSGLPH